jgi:hypothetical protein
VGLAGLPKCLEDLLAGATRSDVLLSENISPESLLELLFLVFCQLWRALLGFRHRFFFVFFLIAGRVPRRTSLFGGRRRMAPSEAGMAPRRWRIAAEARIAPSESLAPMATTTAEVTSPTTLWTLRRSTFACRSRWFFARHVNEVATDNRGAIFSETLFVRNFRHNEVNESEGCREVSMSV